MKPLSLILLLISLTANSSDLSAPQVAIEKYFQYFNAKDIDSLNNASGQPFTLINGGKVSKWSKYGDAVDFGGLESSGWAYSRFLKINWSMKMIRPRWSISISRAMTQQTL